MTLYVQIIITLMVIVIVAYFACMTGYRRALIDVKKSRITNEQEGIDKRMEYLRKSFNSIK